MQHLIDRQTTNIIKSIAILIVVLGHYARFKNAPLPLASHIPYFGAALFSFISGYGTMLAYQDKKIGKWRAWIFGRIRRVYFPFLFINFLSVPLYKTTDIIIQVFLGKNDDVMWYPIFIMGFYMMFAVSMVMGRNIGCGLLCMIGFIFYVVLNISGVSSQYYTSIPALIAGGIIGRCENALGKNSILKVFMAGFICLFSIFCSLKAETTVKYIFTSFSGAFFSVLVFVLIMSCCKEWRWLKFGSVIGVYSYFAYLIHMKIFYVLDNVWGTDSLISFMLFLILTIIFTVLLQNIWMMVDRKIRCF